MKKLILIICLFYLSLSVSIAQKSINITLKIIPENISIDDSVFFTILSSPFSGSCTHNLKVDSIIDANNTAHTKIYISGKYDSGNKCGDFWDKDLNDTINIGLLPIGSYQLIYQFIDITSDEDMRHPTNTYWLWFDVYPFSKVQDNNKIKEIKIYPSPCNSHINIVFPDMDNKHIQLFDVFGKIIFEKNTNQNSLQINMSSYNSGIYFINIESNNNIYNHKIIKN